jgi:hypothetical protein
MKRLLVIFLFAAFPLFLENLKAQYWAPVGAEIDNSVRDITVDHSRDLLYACGAFKMAGDSMLSNIAVYNGSVWDNVGAGCGDSIGDIGNMIYSIEYYNDRTFAGGEFLLVDGINTPIWNHFKAAHWIGCGYPNSTPFFATTNGQLFALGLFDTISGQPFKNIARWNGETWESFNEYPSGVEDHMYCAAYYGGSYYFGGNFNNPGGYKEIVHWDGANWQPLASGILGDSWVNDMVAYKGLLFVAGYFFKSSGNVASSIMAWDGEKWLDPFPGINRSAQIFDLEVIGDELYLGGGWQTRPGYPQPHFFARYDGQQYCFMGDNRTCPQKIQDYNGRIIACGGSFWNGSGDSINEVAEWIGGHTADTCVMQPIGLLDPELAMGNISAYPNPVTQAFELKLPDNITKCIIQIFDLAGRCMLEPITHTSQSSPINVSHLPPGFYLVKASSRDWSNTFKIIKQ